MRTTAQVRASSRSIHVRDLSTRLTASLGMASISTVQSAHPRRRGCAPQHTKRHPELCMVSCIRGKVGKDEPVPDVIAAQHLAHVH